MVDDNGVAARTTRGSVSPANGLGKFCIGIREEELSVPVSVSMEDIVFHPGREAAGLRGLTIESSATLLALPHALMTKASLKATTATTSTPFSLSLGRFSIYPGRWLTEQVGVKAPIRASQIHIIGGASGNQLKDTKLPGTENKTTFLSAHSLEAL
jgi:hypothetical protein